MNEKLKKNWPLLLFFIIFILPILGRNGIIVILIAIGAYFLWQYTKTGSLANILNKLDSNKSNNKLSNIIDVDKLKNMDKMKRNIIGAVLVVFIIWLFFASIQIVDAGTTGVYSLFGKVRDQELRSGFHLVIPLAKVTRMSIRTEEYTMSIVQGEGQRAGADAITALTKEGLNVDLDMTVLYRLQEEKASDVYRELGLKYDEKIIRPTIRTAIRDIIAQYEAKDIYSEKREEAAGKIKDQLAEDLDERGITVENVLLRNVKLPANLANAIQEKLQAEQEAEKYDFILVREKKEKERKVIEAEGRRDAQRIINESLTTNYLYFLYINELKEREGTIYVPTNPSTGMPLFRELGRWSANVILRP